MAMKLSIGPPSWTGISDELLPQTFAGVPVVEFKVFSSRQWSLLSSFEFWMLIALFAFMSLSFHILTLNSHP